MACWVLESYTARRVFQTQLLVAARAGLPSMSNDSIGLAATLVFFQYHRAVDKL